MNIFRVIDLSHYLLIVVVIMQAILILKFAVTLHSLVGSVGNLVRPSPT